MLSKMFPTVLRSAISPSVSRITTTKHWENKIMFKDVCNISAHNRLIPFHALLKVTKPLSYIEPSFLSKEQKLELYSNPFQDGCS